MSSVGIIIDKYSCQRTDVRTIAPEWFLFRNYGGLYFGCGGYVFQKVPCLSEICPKMFMDKIWFLLQNN